MKVADTKEDRLRAHYIEQLNKLGYHDTNGKTLHQLNSILATLRFNRINHDSAANVWFE
jgi:demethoxyubiquinone hydroxylase (CLK1/Coq7/Cat5 family)